MPTAVTTGSPPSACSTDRRPRLVPRVPAGRAPSFDVPEQGWTGISSLDAAATLSADGRKLFVHLINLQADQPMQVRLHIKGRTVNPDADAGQIAPQDFLSRNDFGVTNVYIQHNPVRGASQDFTQTLPPHSATILEINLK